MCTDREMSDMTRKQTLAEATAGVIKLDTNVLIQLIGPNGKLKEERIANTVTTYGKNTLVDQLLAAPSLNKPTHGAVGTGTPSGTALGTELGARTAYSSKTRSSNVLTVAWTVPAGTSTGALTEAGTFDQLALGGNMFMSATFSVINKGAADTLAITWTLTAS